MPRLEPRLELIGAPASNYVRVCRIALAEKGVAYESAAMRDAHANLTAYFERHFARASVQATVPQGPPGRAETQADGAGAA